MRLFSPATLSKAKEVTELAPDSQGDWWVESVRDTDTTYQVKLIFDPDTRKINSARCNCPYGSNSPEAIHRCYHVAAVLGKLKQT